MLGNGLCIVEQISSTGLNVVEQIIGIGYSETSVDVNFPDADLALRSAMCDRR